MIAHDWRKDLDELYRKGEAMEAVASTLPGEVRVRPHWPGIDWVEIGADLETFAAMVTRMSEVMGPPDTCEGEHWLGGADGPPDLIARWQGPDLGFDYKITVRALMPKGCMVDPRTKHVEARYTKIHPQCAAVLRELEDGPAKEAP